MSWDDAVNQDEKHVENLKRLFQSMSNGSDFVNRDSFLDEVERRHPRLLGYLQKTTASSSNDPEKKMSIFHCMTSNEKLLFMMSEKMSPN